MVTASNADCHSQYVPFIAASHLYEHSIAKHQITIEFVLLLQS